MINGRNNDFGCWIEKKAGPSKNIDLNRARRRSRPRKGKRFKGFEDEDE